MRRRLFLGAALAGALYSLSGAVLAQAKIEGKVLSTKLTVCTFKPGGCEGTMVMETGAGGQPAQITVKVPLGTMIKKGDDVVYLPALRGRVIIVEVVADKSDRVAKSISVR